MVCYLDDILVSGKSAVGCGLDKTRFIGILLEEV